jgi:DNA-binding NarL/FixJ family response regulator
MVDLKCAARPKAGEQRLRKLRDSNPDLIVMDFSMPGMNGIEAARCLRQVLPAAVIIILSDYGGMFREEQTSSLGIAAIVSKAECSSVLLHEARTLLHQPAG